MNSHRISLSTIALLIGLTIVIGPGGLPTANAQDIHLPIVGRQFFTLGMEARGGPVIDWSGDSVDLSATAGSRARLGLHHVLSERFSMNAEAAIGAAYLAEHPMAPAAGGDAQVSFDWGLALLARYFNVGNTSGLTFAGGLHYRRASLQTGALLQLGLDGRIGYHVWTSDERFFIVELGLHAPFIEGLSLSQESIEEIANNDETIPDQWYFPSVSLGIQWAF